MAVLGMSREQTLWDTPLASIRRAEAAWLERNGQQVNWGAAEMDRLLDALERLNAPDTERQDSP